MTNKHRPLREVHSPSMAGSLYQSSRVHTPLDGRSLPAIKRHLPISDWCQPAVERGTHSLDDCCSLVIEGSVYSSITS
jgi:hypothetical protein